MQSNYWIGLFAAGLDNQNFIQAQQLCNCTAPSSRQEFSHAFWRVCQNQNQWRAKARVNRQGDP
jgi:hypothetical protein